LKPCRAVGATAQQAGAARARLMGETDHARLMDLRRRRFSAATARRVANDSDGSNLARLKTALFLEGRKLLPAHDEGGIRACGVLKFVPEEGEEDQDEGDDP